MKPRRPNLAAAGVDFTFALLALIAGALNSSRDYLIFIVLGAFVVWTWTRRYQLERMPFRKRVVNGIVAYGIIGVVLIVAFWLGQLLGGHT